MAFSPKSISELDAGVFDTIIDVRSPSEFAEDHVPGAVNLPVLSDVERAAVGTIYKQESPFKARKIGAALVAKNAARHLETALAEKPGGWRPLVYCWRGGQRSGAFASILAQIGWRVDTLAGGYQSYRRLVVRSLYESPFPAQIVLLDGNTGTAKTEILARLSARNVQALDLEAMAGHRGSALGGQGPQPSQKSFESRLARAVATLSPKWPVVLEAESSRIGRINLPPRLFEAMQRAPRVRIEVPVAARARYLCRAYADLTTDTEALRTRLSRLTRLQGHARVNAWVALANRGAFETLAAELIAHHYDPRYAKARRQTAPAAVTIRANRLDAVDIDQLAQDVAKAAEELGSVKSMA